ncbi:unnamed protein product [Vitrella brassicaformis CCMP3155]|uniref:SCP domain-containing protein n=2 Tax=Vitrella brassicaformis TaxID=1169539 RepID=A0A0G4EDC0_VITBC|nr:unnamed protein product [Vitrella brassicaformis CCMP3155]|eukprot:CEL93689.1 unnamed protein product [Vitrella brassicaformis CCMP3155]
MSSSCRSWLLCSAAVALLLCLTEASKQAPIYPSVGQEEPPLLWLKEFAHAWNRFAAVDNETWERALNQTVLKETSVMCVADDCKHPIAHMQKLMRDGAVKSYGIIHTERTVLTPSTVAYTWALAIHTAMDCYGMTQGRSVARFDPSDGRLEVLQVYPEMESHNDLSVRCLDPLDNWNRKKGGPVAATTQKAPGSGKTEL